MGHCGDRAGVSFRCDLHDCVQCNLPHTLVRVLQGTGQCGHRAGVHQSLPYTGPVRTRRCLLRATRVPGIMKKTPSVSESSQRFFLVASFENVALRLALSLCLSRLEHLEEGPPPRRGRRKSREENRRVQEEACGRLGSLVGLLPPDTTISEEPLIKETSESSFLAVSGPICANRELFYRFFRSLRVLHTSNSRTGLPQKFGKHASNIF